VVDKMGNILITQTIPEAGVEFLVKHKHNVEMLNRRQPLPVNSLIKKLRNKNAVLCLLSDTINKKVIDIAVKEGIKCFANYAVGYNNIDYEYAKEKGIYVTNTPDVLTLTTAEMAWALLFTSSRRIIEADKYVRNNKFKGWEAKLLLGKNISGQTLGIIGAGRIGTAFGLMSKGFNMKVLYTDKNKNDVLEEKINAKKVSLKVLLKKSDFISIHTPLLPETKYLINAENIKTLKKGVIIINTSRGPVINEKDLATGLRNKDIFYAGMDVFEKEPEINSELFKLNNVVMTPHIASATEETRDDMAIIAAKNIVEVLKGNKPPNAV
jgi:glyoxylate reductase